MKASNRRIELRLEVLEYQEKKECNITAKSLIKWCEKSKKGLGQGALSKRYRISRYAIQSWFGLFPEVELPHSCTITQGASTQKCTDRILKTVLRIMQKYGLLSEVRQKRYALITVKSCIVMPICSIETSRQTGQTTSG